MTLRPTFVRLGLAILALAAAAAAPARAQTKPPIVARAEQCLRQNVDRVVASDRDLQSAASFLVNYACAGEVSSAARYQRNSAYVQMFSTIFKLAGQSTAATAAANAAIGKPAAPMPDFKASVDPETGDIVVPPSAPGTPPNPIAGVLPMMENIFGQVSPETVPVGLRKLAGDLVLAAHDRSATAAH
jgi:hypothetical protein